MFLFFSSLNGPSGSLNATLPSSSFSTWNVTLKLLICPLLVFLLSQNSQKSFPYLVTVSGHHPVSVFLFSCPCFKWLSWFLLCYMIFAFHSWLKLHSCSSQMIAWSVDCFWALLDISFLAVDYSSWWLRGKESVHNAGDPSSIPGSGRSPGEGNGYSFQNSMGRVGWWATVNGAAKSRTRSSN